MRVLIGYIYRTRFPKIRILVTGEYVNLLKSEELQSNYVHLYTRQHASLAS